MKSKITRIISWNVNGIRAIHKKGNFRWLLEYNPDIFCLQETKAKKEQIPAELINIDGYHAFFVSAEKKGYSGVATYTKIAPINVITSLGIEKFDREGRILLTEYKDFALFNIYFPNGKASKERLEYKLAFYDSFLKYADSLEKQGKSIIVCGDVNTAHKEIDLARPKENEKISGFLPEERAWIDKLLKKGYIDTFRIFNSEPGHYTWWDLKTRARERNVGWRIDYFFVTEDLRENIKAAFIFPDVMGSDHCPLGIEIII